jgi:murein L,D-transpeptidase YcbB/YkuD
VNRFILFYLLTGLLILPACQRSVKQSAQAGSEAAQEVELFFDSLEFFSLLGFQNEPFDHKQSIIEFYRNRDFRFAWINRNGATEHAAQLLNLLQDANDDIPGGLKSLSRVRSNYEKLKLSTGGISERDSMAGMADILFTTSYFEYADKVYSGLPVEVCRNLEWYIPRKKLLYNALLDSALMNQSGFLSSSLPVFHMYHKLRKSLFRYAEIEKSGEYDSVPYTAKVQGDSLEMISRIRRNLILLGDLSPEDSNTGNNVLPDAAIRSFRIRMGLDPEAKIDSVFISEMNIPLSQRMKSILLNMERCRWLPVGDYRRFIVINLPDYSLMIFNEHGIEWKTKVIIGEASTKTIVFTSALKYIVFSPYWNIPGSIIRREIIRAILRDPEYLVKHRMEIMEFTGEPLKGKEREINWRMYQDKSFPFLIRQLPGADNALGRVKFLFPNNYSMYLHDTPARELFSQSSRAFSHGCIRVENPDRLAASLLAGDGLWTEEKISEAMNSGQEEWVLLREEVPVFIVYFTSWVDENGKLHFREDVYGHDDRLAEVLFEFQRRLDPE